MMAVLLSIVDWVLVDATMAGASWIEVGVGATTGAMGATALGGKRLTAGEIAAETEGFAAVSTRGVAGADAGTEAEFSTVPSIATSIARSGA